MGSPSDSLSEWEQDILDRAARDNLLDYQRVREQEARDRERRELEEEYLKRQKGISTLMANNPVTWNPRTWGSGINDWLERGIGNFARGNIFDMPYWISGDDGFLGDYAQLGSPPLGSGLIWEDGVPVGIKEEFSKPGSEFDMYMDSSDNPLVNLSGPDLPGNIMPSEDGLNFLKTRATHDPLHKTYYDPITGKTHDDQTGEELHWDREVYKTNVNHIREWDMAYGAGEIAGIAEGVVAAPALGTMGVGVAKWILNKVSKIKGPIAAGLVSSGLYASEAEANSGIKTALNKLGIKSIDDYIDQAKIKDGDIQFIKKSEISSRREFAETFKEDYKAYLKDTGKKDTPANQNIFGKYSVQKNNAIEKWTKAGRDDADELWSKVVKKAGGTNRNQVISLVDEWIEGGLKNDAGEDVTLEWWLNPTQVDGTPYKNLDKYRKKIRIGAEQWKENRRLTRTDNQIWTKASDQKTWRKAQANRILQWMQDADKQLGDKGEFFKTVKDKDGDFIGIEIKDPEDPSAGITYYKDGYLLSNPEKAKKLGATFDSSGKITYGNKHLPITQHPQYIDVNNYLTAIKQLKLGTPNEAIAKDIAKVLGDDLVVQTGSRTESFSLNFLGGYLYRLDAFKNNQGGSLKSYERLGREEFIEFHHSAGKKHKPYQPDYLQAQTKAENAAASTIQENFYKILDTKGAEEAFSYMSKETKKWPNLLMHVRIGDEPWVKYGPKFTPEKALKRIEDEVTDLYNTHMKGDEDAIRQMAEDLGILKNYEPQISPGLKKMAKKGTERFRYGGRAGQMGDVPINRNDPKRGAVTGPGRYSVDDTKTIFGHYLEANVESAMERRKFDELPEAMKGPMSVFLADEARLARVREAEPKVRYKTEDKTFNLQLKDIKKQIADELIDDKPVKYKWRNIPEAIQRNPIYRSFQRQMQMPFMLMGAIGNDIKNSFTGTDKEFNENFPVLSALVAPQIEKAWMPTPSTDNEAAYIDGFAEINRALDTGITNLGFNTMDLVLGGIDLASFGKTDLSGRLRDLYDEKSVNEPETFLGDMLALLVEFGVPGGLVTKILTRAQKALRIKGVNTMTRFIDDDVYGAARLGMQMSNISKKMGTGAIIFGATDLLAGGPYNSLHRMFPEDPTLLPGKPIETKDLSGNELALANFKNRLRFAGDGAMIGGLFPLVGPAAWGLIKGTAKLPFKTIPGIDRSLFGGALQLAGIPLKIAADTLAGKLAYTNKTLPVIGGGIQKLGQWGAKGIQETAKFIGKQVFTRAALGAYDVAFAKQAAYSGIKFDKTFKRSLPDFQKWREFSVNSQDPLHQYLARIDNKLSAFRDIGKLTRDAFGISGQTNLFIKSKSRVIDKYLKSIEEEAYKMAKVFEDRHKNWGEYQTIQRKYLDDVLDYLQGTIKADALPLRLREIAVGLKEYTNGLKTEFGELLPKSDPLKYLLSADIDKYMRRSFAMFTNADFQPGREAVLNAKAFIKDVIRGNEGFVMQAREAFPDQSIAKAIDEYAELKVADIMHTARYEIDDPFKALEKIVNKKLGLGDIRITTGEEVPAAIRKLLGEEKNLKSSLLQTTGNMIASTQQKTALDRLAKMGLENGWLFNTAEEALAKGKIYNAARLTDVKGTGFLLNDAIGLYGTPEMIRQLSGYSIFDSALKYKVYQNLLAFKAMVQGGKTLYSPATQMRNFGSASLFAMNVGHIGGSASVPQAMKIVLDDIFGSGPKVNKNDLIKYIERKVELGVTDENVVANELAGILADLKGTRSATGEPIISSFNQLLQKVGNTQMSQYVQRTYAGGDNVWKIYGHEFYMSELKQFTKSIDDVKKYFRDVIGREFVELSPKTGIKKTVAEGIEEMGAYLVRETYPTYSRVPPVVQAIRKLPIGNFISFPAEMLRTSATTLSLSLKHIASGNPGLQAMGYRSLFGQFTTLYGVNESVKALGHYLTDVNPDMTAAYLEDLGPAFMEDHALVPLTNQDKKTGMFKAFNLSTYNPYAYVIDPVNGFIRELTTPRLITEIDGEVYNRLFDAAGPLMAFLEPFTTEAIALEPAFDIWARQGRSRDGSIIFSPSDDFGEKVEKSWNHFLGTIAPGFIRSAAQVLDALSLDTKSGRVMELGDVLIRLLGGSIMNVDPVAALDYKAIDIREIRSNAYKTEHFFSKENALERGPDVMAAEFEDIQNEALAAQFEVWKMFQQSLNSGLLTKRQIEKVLGKDGRNVPNLDRLMDGKFTPVSFSRSGLTKRADDLYEEYKRNGIILNKSDLKPFSKLRRIMRTMKRIKFEDLLDPNRAPLLPSTEPTPALEGGIGNMFSQNQVAPLPNTPTPDVSQVNMNQGADPQTGLTKTETALLSPSEKLIQQRQRGMV